VNPRLVPTAATIVIGLCSSAESAEVPPLGVPRNYDETFEPSASFGGLDAEVRCEIGGA
jgi:hypothetical protein